MDKDTLKPIPRSKNKLRWVTWSVVTLATAHVFLGSYSTFPFIPWTMFSDKDHKSLSKEIGDTEVLAVDKNGEVIVLNFSNLAGMPGAGGGKSSLVKNITQKLKKQHPKTIKHLVEMAETFQGVGNVKSLMVVRNIWYTNEALLKGPYINDNREKDADERRVEFNLNLDE